MEAVSRKSDVSKKKRSFKFKSFTRNKQIEFEEQEK